MAYNDKADPEETKTRGINLIPFGTFLGIPETTFTVLFFAGSVIALYFAFISGSLTTFALISYFGISAVTDFTNESFGYLFFDGDISDRSGDDGSGGENIVTKWINSEVEMFFFQMVRLGCL